MFLGPIHPVLPGLTTGHNPIKPIKVVSNTGKQTVLFDQDYSYATQPAPLEIDAETVIFETSAANALARMTQIVELMRNTEWHRCGVFIQWREDAVTDQEDGWYNLKSLDVSDEFIYSSYAEPQIHVEQRSVQRASIGVFVDSKALPNDANLGGVGLAALPAGFTPQYPAATWTLVGANGNIPVFENPISVMRATLVTPNNTMTQGRCVLTDEA